MTTITLEDGSLLDLGRWPLPEGVEDDGTPLNRVQLARAFGVSENTITKWVGLGMPVLSGGQNGVSYEFSLRQCHAWRQQREAKLQETKARGDQLAAQAALAFRNLDDDRAEEEAELTADDLRKWSEAEYHRNRVAEQRGDLVRVDRLRSALDDIFVTFGAAMETLPDFAEMEFGLSPDQVEKIKRRCDQTRDEVRRKIEALVERPGAVIALGTRQGELSL
ncbi:terminase small subunit [Paenirhodobacter enshiensis]|uniref:terminase small subunit n=1 Tax=Paenirhodobacter enshiensis TaxID=1105367 RepID=UPI003FA1CE80